MVNTLANLKVGNIPNVSIMVPSKTRDQVLLVAGIIALYYIADYVYDGAVMTFAAVASLLMFIFWIFGRVITLDERNGYLLDEPADSVRDDAQGDICIISAAPRHGRIKLGKVDGTNEELYWEYMHPKLRNRHMTIIGGSGGGKTYTIQCLLDGIADLNVSSTIIDYTDGFLPQQLEKEFIDSVSPKTHLLAKKPLSVNPFVRQERQIVKGETLTEDDFSVATRITSVFTSVYSSLGEQQIALLIRVIEENLTDEFSFSKLIWQLKNNEEEYPKGALLAAKLEPFVKSKPFSEQGIGWSELLNAEDSKAQIVQLASLSRDVQRTIAEFALWDLWDYAVSNGTKHKPIPVVLDEVQNLDHKSGSPIDKILTEGRKFGLSAIQATQFLSRFSKSEKDRLFQAAHKLIFQPADTEMADVARMMQSIDPEDRDVNYWKKELASLGLGQCFSIGMSANTGEPVMRVVKVNIASFSMR